MADLRRSGGTTLFRLDRNSSINPAIEVKITPDRCRTVRQRSLYCLTLCLWALRADTLLVIVYQKPPLPRPQRRFAWCRVPLHDAGRQRLPATGSLRPDRRPRRRRRRVRDAEEATARHLPRRTRPSCPARSPGSRARHPRTARPAQQGARLPALAAHDRLAGSPSCKTPGWTGPMPHQKGCGMGSRPPRYRLGSHLTWCRSGWGMPNFRQRPSMPMQTPSSPRKRISRERRGQGF